MSTWCAPVGSTASAVALPRDVAGVLSTVFWNIVVTPPSGGPVIASARRDLRRELGCGPNEHSGKITRAERSFEEIPLPLRAPGAM